MDSNLLFHKRNNKLQKYNEIRLGDSSLDKALLYKYIDKSSNPRVHVKSQASMIAACNTSTHEEGTGDPWVKLTSQNSQNW